MDKSCCGARWQANTSVQSPARSQATRRVERPSSTTFRYFKAVSADRQLVDFDAGDAQRAAQLGKVELGVGTPITGRAGRQSYLARLIRELDRRPTKYESTAGTGVFARAALRQTFLLVALAVSGRAHPGDADHIRHRNCRQQHDHRRDDGVKCNAEHECSNERDHECCALPLTGHNPRCSNRRARSCSLVSRLKRVQHTACDSLVASLWRIVTSSSLRTFGAN